MFTFPRSASKYEITPYETYYNIAYDSKFGFLAVPIQLTHNVYPHVFASADGVHWSAVQLGQYVSSSELLAKDGIFFNVGLVGRETVASISADGGRTWSYSGNANDLYMLGFPSIVNGQFYIPLYNSIIKSTDGLSFSTALSTPSNFHRNVPHFFAGSDAHLCRPYQRPVPG